MTAPPTSHGNAFHHTNAASSNGNAQPTSCLHPEWMPLDGIAQAWAAFGAEASNPAAFQTTGMAFLALAFEASAHQHYATSVSSTGSKTSPLLANTQGIEHAIADLDEATQHWQSVLLWLDQLARETRQQAEIPASVEQLASLVLEQQQRALSLLLRVQQEYLNVDHEPLLISLGYLPATPDKAG